jgi:Flp pilus assembly protein TadD
VKFNNALLSILMLSVSLSLVACSTNKNAAETPAKKAGAEVAAPAQANATAPAPSSVLPSGPRTPNPYSQNVQKYSEQVEVNFQDAANAIRQKNWTRAESVLAVLAEKNPQLSGVHVNLGIVYKAKGDNEKAAAEFNRAITANNKNVEAYNHLAVLKREAGDFAAAESLYQKALTIWPFYPEGHKNIAILYDLYLGKPEQALPHYLAYQQLLPTPDKQLDSWIAELQRRLGIKPAPKAQEKPAEPAVEKPAETTTPDEAK